MGAFVGAIVGVVVVVVGAGGLITVVGAVVVGIVAAVVAGGFVGPLKPVVYHPLSPRRMLQYSPTPVVFGRGRF